MELVAPAGRSGPFDTHGLMVLDMMRVDHRVVASQAGKHQVLVERRFQRAGIGDAQHGVGGLDVVGDAEPRLYLVGRGDAVVHIAAQTRG